jgi:hypothetical protein
MNEPTDYYVLLGVDRNASPSTIKAAFKKLALQYHPDVYKGDDAAERMRLILEAYQTLNNPKSRQQYNARLSRGVYGNAATSDSGYSTTSSPPRGQTSVSPGARRDRQRYYDFPKFSAGQSVVVDLIDIEYTLTPAETEQLAREGLLRGTMSISKDHRYYCHRCHYRWPAPSTHNAFPPRACPKCNALDWAEFLLMRCVHCSAVFESEQIRNEVGSYTYGAKRADERTPPYELFPLCPYCGMAHWSPGEERRVALLRQAAARRAMIQRVMWISVAIVVLMLVGFVLLNGVR